MVEQQIPRDMCTICDFRRMRGGCGEKDFFNSETPESVIEIVAQRARDGICKRAKHIGELGVMHFNTISTQWEFVWDSLKNENFK